MIINIPYSWNTCDIMVVSIQNGHEDPSSNPGCSYLYLI